MAGYNKREDMHGTRRIFAMLTISCTLTIVSPAVCDTVGARPTPKQGEVLITAGLIVQGLGVGLHVAAIIEEGTTHNGELIVGAIPYHITSIPFAPLTTVGFAAYHDTPERLGWRRGYTRGLLEGAAFAGAIVGLRGLRWIAWSAWCARNPPLPGEHPGPCSEDIILFMIWDLPVMASHGIVGLGMLAAGLITLAVADHAQDSVGSMTGVELGLTPLPGGLAVVGRF